MYKKSENKSEAPIILDTETVLINLEDNGIHENQLSLTHGFLPHQPLKESLPPEFKAWDDLQRALPQLIAKVGERKAFMDLPLLDAMDPVKLPNEYLSRAASILGNLAHAYYYNERHGTTQEVDALPPSIRIPWEQVNARLGRRLGSEPSDFKAFRSCYDTLLSNFKIVNPNVVIDGGENNLRVQGSDLDLINYASGTQAERVNNTNFVLAEIRFAAAIKPIMKAIYAAATQDDEEIIQAFKAITYVLEKVTEALDYFTPNQYSSHYVDQVIWTKTAATFDTKIPGGHSGLSGSELPMFQAMDIFFERPGFATHFGKEFARKYDILPPNKFKFLNALHDDINKYSLRAYAASSDNPLVKMQYQAMFDSFLNLMFVHRVKAFGYLQINFLNGRPLTNGGNTGERNIFNGLTEADSERGSNYTHYPYYANRVSTRLLGQTASEVILDVRNTGLDFNPGDRCMVIPQNSTQHVSLFLEKQEAIDPLTPVHLNARWQRYFKEEVGLKVQQLSLEEFLKYVALDEIKDKKLPQEINSDLFYPILPRQYSQSPMGYGEIRLTVGQHTYVEQGQQLSGISSGFLIHGDNTQYAIKKVTARHFHLPDNNETPILMFAAGSGIAPFMGFIDARKRTSSAQKNWLFYSVRDKQSFIYADELTAASRDNQLHLSVGFTRSQDASQNKRINTLIDENAAAIAAMIMEQGAHVFVCGNSGFSQTVMESIIKALESSNQPHAEAYVDTMVADHRYKIDVFTQHSDEQFPSFYPSEIAAHNKQNDCWVIINESNQAGKIIARNVYDLNKSKFDRFHPGGQKILLVNAGTNATDEYNIIGHNRDQQINAMLKSCQIGVVAAPPQFESKEEETFYNKSIACLEILTKLENNIGISNNLFLNNPAPYLWRNTLIGFFGREADGSFQQALRIFEDLCQLRGLPKQDFNLFYEQLSQCAVFIFDKTQTPENSEEIQQLRSIYDAIIKGSSEFVSKMKEIIRHIAQDLEKNNTNSESLLKALEQIDRLVKAHIKPTEHLCKQLGITADVLKKGTSAFESAAFCPVVRPKNNGKEFAGFNVPLVEPKETKFSAPPEAEYKVQAEEIHPVAREIDADRPRLLKAARQVHTEPQMSFALFTAPAGKREYYSAHLIAFEKARSNMPQGEEKSDVLLQGLERTNHPMPEESEKPGFFSRGKKAGAVLKRNVSNAISNLGSCFRGK